MSFGVHCVISWNNTTNSDSGKKICLSLQHPLCASVGYIVGLRVWPSQDWQNHLGFFKTLVNNSKRNCIHQCLDHTPTLYLWRRMPVPDGSDDHFRKAISSRLNHCACPGCGKLIAAPPSDCRPCQGKITLVRLDLPPYGTFLWYLEGDWCICYSSSNQKLFGQEQSSHTIKHKKIERLADIQIYTAER